MPVLTGPHDSPDTAYVVNDYPYGFRLRCKIRYWLDSNPRKGTRFVSQTTNPKKPGEVWNKPKASTYSEFGGAMFLDDVGHVKWSGVSQYDDVKACISWFDTFCAGLPDVMLPVLKNWIAKKLQYDTLKAAGKIVYRIRTSMIGAPLVEESKVLEPELTPEDREAYTARFCPPVVAVSTVLVAS